MGFYDEDLKEYLRKYLEDPDNTVADLLETVAEVIREKRE